jgi:hypothetical protein
MFRLRFLLSTVILTSFAIPTVVGSGQEQNASDPPSTLPIILRRALPLRIGQKIPARGVPFEPRHARPRTSTEGTSLRASIGLDASAVFMEARTFGSGGSGADSVAVADVNADGNPDVVVANACVSGSFCQNPAAGSVGVLLGNGDGTFQPAVSYLSNGNETTSVAVADVNGDGKPDLLVASECANGGDCTYGVISVLLGNGDGTFQAAVTFSMGLPGGPSLTVADVNGDGKPDLMVVQECMTIACTSGAVGVWLGNGDGTFQPAVSYGSGGEDPYSAIVADVNGDGKPDLIVTNQGILNGSIGVLLGNGDGTFQQAVSYDSGGQEAYSTAVADVNGDGKPDLVVVNFYVGNGNEWDGSVGVLLGNGDGTFLPAVTYSSGGSNGSSIAVSDLNGDGKPDLLVGSGVLSILWGRGDGTFQPAVSYASGGTGTSLVVADVNGDGKPDVLAAGECPSACSNGNGTVGVLLGNGDGSIQAAVIYPSGGYNDVSLAVADLNGDDKQDLLVANLCVARAACDSGAVGVLLGNGDGTFRPPVTYGSGGYYAQSVAVADVNGDGNPDLLVANQCLTSGTCAGDGAVGVLLGNGDGAFRTAVSYGSGGENAYSVAVADVNGDGKPDLLVANWCVSNGNCANGTVGVLLGNGDGTFRTVVVYGSGGQYAVSVAVADVNGDGRPDLLVGNYYTGNGNSIGSLGVLLGNGDGTFQTAVSYNSGGLGTNSVTVGDVNGDGKPDLLGANQCADSTCANGSLGVLLGNGDGTFQPAIASTTPVLNFDYIGPLAVADFNGDGKLDVASGSGDFLLLGNGDGTFQQLRFLGALGVGIAAGDFNGDGRPDLAIGGVAVLLNITGPPRTMTTTQLTSSLNSSTYGQSVTFSAAVTSTSDTPAGTVTFTDGNATLGSATLINGNGSLSTSALFAGTHSIVANYIGNAKNSSSVSSALQHIVNQESSRTTLSSSVNPSVLNQSVTFTANVLTQFGEAVTGSVTFKLGTTTLAAVPVVSNQATYTLTLTSTGTSSITAEYSGDSNTLGSTSAVLEQVVYSLPVATVTTIATSGSPSFINQSVTFTAKATSASGPIPNGEVVKFSNGTIALASVPLAGGIAAYTTSALKLGTHTVKAAYPGDATFKASTGSVTQIVNLYPSSVGEPGSSLNPSVYGQSVKLTATVTSTAPNVPTGTVTFKNAAANLGTVALDTNGSATLTRTTISAGADPITAAYNGNAQTAKSTSAVLMQVVNQAVTSTKVASSSNPSTVGQTVTLTATVKSATTSVTGSVTFLDGTNTLGTVSVVGGKASYSTSELSAGSHSIEVVYSGTINIGGSTSPVLVQEVN